MHCFAARSTDPETLKRSTSGGVFSELARVTLARSGIVFGAAWAQDYASASHVGIKEEKDLDVVRGTKYCPSDLGQALPQIESALADGRPVLFVGLPCQTASLRRRFGDCPELILCGLFCHSVPESWVWRRYVQELENSHGARMMRVDFRNKRTGWRRSAFVAEFENGSVLEEYVGENDYFRAFNRGYSSRTACLDCRFRGERSGADLMIGDFWGIELSHPDFDDPRGVSAVIVYSERGMELVKAASLDKIDVNYETMLQRNPFLEASVNPDLGKRARFLAAYRGGFTLSESLRIAERRPFWARVWGRIQRMWGMVK